MEISENFKGEWRSGNKNGDLQRFTRVATNILVATFFHLVALWPVGSVIFALYGCYKIGISIQSINFKFFMNFIQLFVYSQYHENNIFTIAVLQK